VPHIVPVSLDPVSLRFTIEHPTGRSINTLFVEREGWNIVKLQNLGFA